MQSMSPTNQWCLNAKHKDLARYYQSQNNPSCQTMSTCPNIWTQLVVENFYQHNCQLNPQEHSIKLD